MDQKLDLPIVSVIIPVYNGAEFIGDCLKKILNQNYPSDKLEVIVVNNLSTDESESIIKKFNVRYLEATTPGPAAARNKGLKEATGSIILLIDGDCLADKDLVLTHVLTHQDLSGGNPLVKIVAGSIQGLNKNFWALCDDFYSWSFNQPNLPNKYVRTFPTANLSFSREILDKDKFTFDENLKSGEDYDFCNKCTRKGYKIFFQPKARVLHINRTSFKNLKKHASNWTRSELSLRKKGSIIPKKRSSILWFLFFTSVSAIVALKILITNLQLKRFSILFCLPFILLNEIIFYLQVFKVEITYKKLFQLNNLQTNLKG